MRRLFPLGMVVLLIASVCSLRSAPSTYGAGPQPTVTAVVEPTVVTQRDADLSLTAHVRGNGSYRVGSWLPVTVTVQNDGADMVGDVRISSSGDSAQYGTTVDLPRGSRKSVTVYVRTNRFARRLTVRMLQGSTQVVQQQIVVEPHSVLERLVAVASGGTTAFRMPPTLADGAKIVAVPIAVADFPAQFAGFSSFDALVLDDLPLNELQPAQTQALREWIIQGGQLIINGGQGAERTLASLPDELRPVTLAGTSSTVAADLLLDPPDGATAFNVAHATALPGSTAMGNVALAAATDQQVLFGRPLGKGSILFSSLRLNEPALAAWERAGAFWSDLLAERDMLPPGFGPDNTSPEQMAEGNIASALTRLPALALPSLTLLGLLLLTYVVLAGPVTYLVLRKLDRQALGWVVVPALTVLFAGIGYGVAYAQRGGDVIVNEITLIQPLGEGHARVRAFVGLFSPAHRSYSIDLPQQQLLRPLPLGGAWDTTEQPGFFSPTSAREVEVPQWSMRALMGESVQPFDGLRATVRLDGHTLQGEVINDTDRVLRDVALVQDVNVGKVGDLLPGERKTVVFGGGSEAEQESRRAKFSGASLSYVIYSNEIEQQGQRGQPLPPMTQLRQGLLDSLYAAGPVQRSATPLLIAWDDTPSAIADVPAQKVARQQIALITLEPSLELAQQQISLDQGWLQRGIETSDATQSQVVCMGSKGLGMNLYGQTVIQTLTLPDALRGIQADEMQLIPSADGPWPEDLQLEVYDWTHNTWVSQELNGQRPVTVSEPARFLSNHTGQIRARINGKNSAQGGGCVYLDATVAGHKGPA